MKLVFSVGLKYFRDSSKAEDLVIDVYEILDKKLANQDIKNVSSWIYSVARNECLMELRRTKKEYSTDGEEFRTLSVESNEFLHLFSDESSEAIFERLEDCIEQLNKDQNLSIKEFYLKQKTYKNIALEHEIDIKKVKSLIQNGKRNLKNCMEGKSK